MPKIRRARSQSNDCTRSHPYPSNSRNDELHKPKNLVGSVDDVKEWEDARCPICMESPHNAVLLKCSSHEMGCRPYMCNTSYRHSNCLDQFCKSFGSHLSSTILQEIPLTSTTSNGRDVQLEPRHSPEYGSQLQAKLICPLCRGEIFGYMVLEPARRHMNSKPRSCASETCEFQGTYAELRKHARSEHPSVRPSEVDPSRQSDWTRMERERDLEDLFSSIHARSDVDNRDTMLTGDLADLMSFFLYEIFSSIEDANRMASLMSSSRHRMPLHDRRSGTMQRIPNGTQRSQSARWRSNLPLAHQPERTQRGRNISSSRAGQANRPARWRTNLSLSSRMPREAHQYYREVSPGLRMTSSTRMSRSGISRTTPENTPSFGRNYGNSSSGRTAGHHLRWRDQGWSSS
ncbi:hypothetical protein HN51_038514 [Arachis hypogaea]|uniref:Uncharacterized protein n=1 Tax=Arachis hypogaea TaxID=3818 RepID=A0A444ZRL6_ARAHY|nr:uncharacterized protein LOC112792692 [Arachis hypogaea]QHO04252.1 uncharacterized protein DS421_13g438890 [Arachis hypogaea]RYR16850.1 hypothetical protein Ahy_B03g061719 [Arachis hypogaea]